MRSVISKVGMMSFSCVLCLPSPVPAILSFFLILRCTFIRDARLLPSVRGGAATFYEGFERLPLPLQVSTEAVFAVDT